MCYSDSVMKTVKMYCAIIVSFVIAAHAASPERAEVCGRVVALVVDSLDVGKLETRRLVYGVYRYELRSITMLVGKLVVRVTEGDTRL